MTEAELKALEATKDAWNAFLQLPVNINEDDVRDFRFHIHALQNIILAREGSRALKRIELAKAGEVLKNIPAPSFIDGGIVKGPSNGIM